MKTLMITAMFFCFMSTVQPVEIEYPEARFTAPVYDVMGQVHHYTEYQFEGINGKWKNASEFSNGLAAVSPDGEYDASKDYDYTIYVEYRGKWGFIDTDGELVIPAKYDYVYKFNDFGLALVGICQNNPNKPWYFDMKWGYIDKTGKEVIPIEFDITGEFLEDDAVVMAKLGDRSSHDYNTYWDEIDIYNSKGEKLSCYPYSNLSYARQIWQADSIYSFRDGLVAFETYGYDEDHVWRLGWNLVDTKGQVVKVLDRDVGEVFSFENGVSKVAHITTRSKCLENWTDPNTGYFYQEFYYNESYVAYIDQDGNYLIPEAVNHAYPDIPDYFSATSEHQTNDIAASSDTFRFIT